MAVLLIACSAVVSGARSFVAIDEWATDAPQDVLARPGARTSTALAVRIPPSSVTIRRVIKDTCPGDLADLLGHDPAGAVPTLIDYEIQSALLGMRGGKLTAREVTQAVDAYRQLSER